MDKIDMIENWRDISEIKARNINTLKEGTITRLPNGKIIYKEKIK